MVSLPVVGTGGASPSGSRVGRNLRARHRTLSPVQFGMLSDLRPPVRAAALLTERVVYEPNLSPCHPESNPPETFKSIKPDLPPRLRPRRPQEFTSIGDTSNRKGKSGVAGEDCEGGSGEAGLQGEQLNPTMGNSGLRTDQGPLRNPL